MSANFLVVFSKLATQILQPEEDCVMLDILHVQLVSAKLPAVWMPSNFDMTVANVHKCELSGSRK